MPNEPSRLMLLITSAGVLAACGADEEGGASRDADRPSNRDGVADASQGDALGSSFTGRWSGTTDDGGAVVFEISSAGSLVSFEIELEISIGTGRCTGTFRAEPAIPADGRFELTGALANPAGTVSGVVKATLDGSSAAGEYDIDSFALVCGGSFSFGSGGPSGTFTATNGGGVVDEPDTHVVDATQEVDATTVEIAETEVTSAGEVQADTTPAPSQPGWAFGGAFDDQASAVVTVADRIVIGGSRGIGTDDGDAWLLALDEDGRILWEDTVDFKKYDAIRALSVESEGFSGCGTVSPNVAFVSDMALFLAGSDGSLSTPTTYARRPSDEYEHDACLAHLSLADGYLLVGVTETGPNTTDDQGFVVRTDRSGAAQWTKVLGASNRYDSLRSALAVADGFYLAGTSNETGHGSGSNATRPWLLRAGPDGEIAWEKTYDDPMAEEDGVALVALPGGGLVFVGMIGDFDEKDPLLLRLDDDGVELWRKSIPNPGNDSVSRALVHGDGLVLVGRSDSRGAGGDDLYLVSVDLDGEVQWQGWYGGAADEDGYAVAATPSGFVAVGATQSMGAGRRDAYVVRVGFDGSALDP